MNDTALYATLVGPGIEPPPAWPRLDMLALPSLPSLVIWGTLDFSHLLKRMRHVVATLPGAPSPEIANSAHLPNLPNLECPDEFTAVVARFLASLDR